MPHQLPGEEFGFQIYVIYGFQGQIAVIIRFQTTFIRFLVKAAVVTVRWQPVAQHWWVDLMAVAIIALHTCRVSFF